jgi:hypothetical protein
MHSQASEEKRSDVKMKRRRGSTKRLEVRKGEDEDENNGNRVTDCEPCKYCNSKRNK